MIGASSRLQRRICPICGGQIKIDGAAGGPHPEGGSTTRHRPGPTWRTANNGSMPAVYAPAADRVTNPADPPQKAKTAKVGDFGGLGVLYRKSMT
jgi:hypothetical protein